MENRTHRHPLLKKLPVKLVFLALISSIFTFGIFQLMHFIGWPETVRWFFGGFILIFIFLSGILNIMNARGAV